MNDSSRDQFLLAMYHEMWGNINRQISLSWQPLTVVIAVGVVLKTAFSGTIPFGIAVSLGLMAVTWFVAHLYDCNRWFYRNQAIIANIEQYFAAIEDKKTINPFMGDLVAPAKAAQFLSTFRVHRVLGVVAAACLLGAETLFELWPAVDGAAPVIGPHDAWWVLVLPWITLVGAVAYLCRLSESNMKQYAKVYRLGKEGRLIPPKT